LGDYYREPARSAEAGRLPAPSYPPAGPPRPGVLVADHDATVRSLLHAVLYRSGFAVYLAADGPEAVEVYRRWRGVIKLVLLDLHLESRDSFDVLGQLKKLNPEVRCCFTASCLGRFPSAELLASGALRVFMKPFSLADVARDLRELAAEEAPCAAAAAC